MRIDFWLRIWKAGELVYQLVVYTFLSFACALICPRTFPNAAIWMSTKLLNFDHRSGGVGDKPNITAFFLLGRAQMYTQKYSEALKYFEPLTEYFRKNQMDKFLANTLGYMAYCNFRLGKKEDAKLLINEARFFERYLIKEIKGFSAIVQ